MEYIKSDKVHGNAPMNFALLLAVLFLVAVFLGLTLGFGSAVADEKSVTEQILDILKREGKISEEKYQELTRKARQEKGNDTDFKTYWKDGLRFESEDGKFKMRLGGRIQVDWANIGADDPMKRDIENAEGSNLEGDGTEFRRARVFLSGSIYDSVDFKMEYDFAGGDADFKDVYLGLRGLPYIGHIKVGHMKEPYSLEQLTSSNHITFMERALPVETFAPSNGRNTGIKLHNSLLDNRMTWGIGAFYDVGDSGDSFDDVQNWDIGARVTWLPWYQKDGAGLLHIGLSYRHEFRDEGEPLSSLRYRQRFESHMTDARILNTGIFDADSVDVLAPELALVLGPFSLQGEYFHSEVDSGTGGSQSFHGFYLQSSWFLTGEHRMYRTSGGHFDRTKPEENFHPAEGGLGAWEFALRYSTVDLGDAGIMGGEARNYTAGLNWYLNPNVRWSFNYVRSDLNERSGVSDGDATILQSRFHIDF